MNSTIQQQPVHEIFNTVQSMLQTSSELAKNMVKACEDIFKIQSESIQSESGSGETSQAASRLSPFFSNEGFSNMIWQLPTQYQSQSERMLKAMHDTYSVVSRVQKQQLELLEPSMQDNIQKTTHLLSQVNGALASRRATAEVINFADRRAASKLKSDSAQPLAGAEASSETGRGNNRPAVRQAAG